MFSTSSNSADQRLKGNGPGVVPGTDDEDKAEGLRLDVNLIRHGQEVLLHGPRSRPLCELLQSQADLCFQSQSLKQLSSKFTLNTGAETKSQELLTGS